MPSIYSEKWMFSNLSPWKPQKCVLKSLRTGLVFPGQLIWGVTCLGLFSKWMFCYLSPWKPHKWVLKPSEEGSFLPDNQFEGSHAYIYLKNEHFPIYLLGNCINVCWNPQNRALFSKMTFERSHAYVYSQNECFHLFSWQLHNCVLKSSEQDSFFQDDQFEGSHA